MRLCVIGLTRKTLIAELTALKAALTEGETMLQADHSAGAGGNVIVQRRTALIDRALKDIYRLHETSYPLPTLVAIGGYGRGELNPFSDIDIMLLCRDERQRERASPLLYSFWDAGLDIGYSVRTAAECVELARNDVRIRTSLLESRFISGDTSFFESYLKRMHADVFQRKTAQFIAEKIAERSAARQKYGGSIYLREPNIKESPGGLRDVHMARWLAMSRYRISSFGDLVAHNIISPSELALYHRTLNFLWRVRNEIHYLSGRKNDQLTYDLQETAAKDFRYRDSFHLMAVERFMKSYFLHARNIQQFSRMITERCLPPPRRPAFGRPRSFDGFLVMGKTLLLPPGVSYAERPDKVLEGFEICRERGLVFSEGLRHLVLSIRIDEKGRGSEAMRKLFLALLDRPEGLSATLTLMRDLKFLGKYIPEFRAVQGLARHDYFHLFTVDEHILTALRVLEDLWAGRQQGLATLSHALHSLKRRWVLMFAVLLHDLGKFYRDHHDRRGGVIARKVLDRVGIEGGDRERILFLVESHLLMSDLSQRRELSDGAVITDFAAKVGDAENLSLLYLLTYADMAAVSPSSWTPWKATLLQDLYLRTLERFEHPVSRTEDGLQRLDALGKRMRTEAGDVYSAQELDAFLATMPRHYLLATPFESLLEHLALVRRLPEERLVIQHRHLRDRGCTELTICAYDAYGMFFRAAGTIAAHNLSIVRAKVFTARNGVMMDTFEITGADGSMVSHDEIWETVHCDLREALVNGRRPPESRITGYERKTPGIVLPSVSFDNVTSDTLTIIDITARDRVGLLYRIARTLFELNIDIASAKITTEGIKAIDAFYVGDLFGAKITDPDRMDKIRDALMAVLSERRASS